jgi:hypothetical protein
MHIEYQILTVVAVLCGLAIALQLSAWNRSDQTTEVEGASADGGCVGDGGSCGTC